MPRGKSPTQRSVSYLEELGYIVGKVEQTIPHTHIKRDLFGMFDLIAVGSGTTIGVQVTSRANIPARVQKITNSDNLPKVRDANWWVWVMGWDKDKEGRDRVRIKDLS